MILLEILLSSFGIAELDPSKIRVMKVVDDQIVGRILRIRVLSRLISMDAIASDGEGSFAGR